MQDDLNTENIRSSFDQSNTRSFSSQQQHEIHPQVNYNHKHVHFHQLHDTYIQKPLQPLQQNIPHEIFQNNRDHFYPNYNHEPFQQETVTSITNTERQRLPVFKVQRDPTGKLGIVLNNTNGFQENGNEYDILTTNQSQRSTTRDTFITTPRPPQPSRRAQHQGGTYTDLRFVYNLVKTYFLF